MIGAELHEDCEVILDEPNIVVFTHPGTGTTALLRIDENLDPLEGGDPNDYGYLPTEIFWVDDTFQLMLAGVIPISDIIRHAEGLSVEDALG
ncbi:hypothetical protein [Brevibacterium album]|uniref:hypothetical protein n=1 Tax=Brevibacterium album TaxID=417948 RepID=UPI0004063E92|nr:hypothetical protein [Brevibacterium album]